MARGCGRRRACGNNTYAINGVSCPVPPVQGQCEGSVRFSQAVVECRVVCSEHRGDAGSAGDRRGRLLHLVPGNEHRDGGAKL